MLPSPTQQVFEHWLRATGRKGKNLSFEAKGRDRKVRARLKDGLTVEQLCRAIDGCAGSDFHMKRGDYAGRSGPRYDDLELICRSKPKTLEFIELRGEQEATARAGEQSNGSDPHLEARWASLVKQGATGGMSKEEWLAQRR